MVDQQNKRKQARIIVAMEQLKYLNHSPCIHQFSEFVLLYFPFLFDCSIKIMVYHERQSRQLCALHVLNNLLQVKNS